MCTPTITALIQQHEGRVTWPAMHAHTHRMLNSFNIASRCSLLLEPEAIAERVPWVCGVDECQKWR